MTSDVHCIKNGKVGQNDLAEKVVPYANDHNPIYF